MNAVVEPTPACFANPLVRYFAATRPAFLTATLAACLLGLASARHSGIPVSLHTATVTILLALLVHAAVNVLNDYFDALNGTDAINIERLYPFTGGSRFIQNGILTLGQTAQFGYGLLLFSMLGGLWLAWQAGSGLLVIGAAGLFIGWAYSAAPCSLNSRGLGELCVLAGFLGVVIGADFVQRKAFSMAPVLIGLPYSLLVTNLLYINQFPDRKADREAGKLHLVARWPLEKAVWLYPLLAAASFGCLAASVRIGALPAAAMISALPLLFSLLASRLLVQFASMPSRLLPAIRMTLAAMLGHAAVLIMVLFMEGA